MRLAQLTQGLNEKAAKAPRCLNVPWGRSPQLNGRLSNPHVPRGAVGEEHRLRRHLFGKPQEVCRVSARRLQPDTVSTGKGARDGFGGWGEESKNRMSLGEIVHPACEASDDALPGQPVQGDIHRLPAAEVQKVVWDENRSVTSLLDRFRYLGIN